MGNAGKASAKKRTRGRPPLKPGRGKRSSFNTRITSQLKERLERDAKSAGRSLSEQIERRLEEASGRQDVAVIARLGEEYDQTRSQLEQKLEEWEG